MITNRNLIDLQLINNRQIVKKNSIVFGDKGVDVTVSLFVFKEGDIYIAYCPSLDLSGYDYTADGACSDFEYMLTDYLNHQLENGTLRADLVSHGWKLGDLKANEPELSEMLISNSQLKKLVASPFSKTNYNKSCHIPS
jgi:hypothetical protein